jgi:hypothetical protein
MKITESPLGDSAETQGTTPSPAESPERDSDDVQPLTLLMWSVRTQTRVSGKI